jgi:hypothetical protein
VLSLREGESGALWAIAMGAASPSVNQTPAARWAVVRIFDMRGPPLVFNPFKLCPFRRARRHFLAAQ